MGPSPRAHEPTGSETNGSEPTESSVTETTEDAFASVPEVETPSSVPDQLVRTVLHDGPSDNPEAKDGDVVGVYYVGVLSADGTQFDTNYGSGKPLTFTLGAGGVIDGWDQGLVGAREGDQIQLDVPADLAYGDQPPANSNIPASAALTFVIDVVDVT